MAAECRLHRKGIALLELQNRIPYEAAARKWFEAVVWPDGGLSCLRCESTNLYACKHKTTPYR